MQKRIFVAGGTGFLGFRVIRALLEKDAKVTALIQPDNEDKLGPLRNRIDCVEGDVWNPASLKGRARGHSSGARAEWRRRRPRRRRWQETLFW